MSWPAGVRRSDDIAVGRIHDMATVHRPHGCPDSEQFVAPFPGAYQVEPFEVFWCTRPGCFPDQAPRRRPNSRSYSPIPPFWKEAPHAA